MNAKEKAKEMYDKMLNSDIMNMTKYCAKQCALIAVDEMIIQNGELYLLGLAKNYYIKKNAYLFDVKSELQSF
jgi:hypothetical protein